MEPIPLPSVAYRAGTPKSTNRLGVLICSVVLLSLTTSALSGQGPTARWALGSGPLTIGEDGNPQYEFQWIGGAVRSRSGEIAVVNGGTKELRVFDPAGKYARAYGRHGAGPGEFESISLIGRSNDSLFLYDGTRFRLSTFTISSGYISSAPVTASPPTQQRGAQVYPLERFVNGSILVMPLGFTSMRHPDGVFRDSVQFGVLSPQLTDPVAWFGRFPYMTHLVRNPENRERAQSVGIYRFGPRIHWAVFSNAFWLGDSAGDELVAMDQAGRVVRRIRLGWTPPPFAAQTLSRSKERALSGLRSARDSVAVAARYDRRYLPGVEPTFDNLITCLDGSLWVERFRTDPLDETTALIIHGDGRKLAEIAIPGGFVATEVGSDYVLGVHTNEDGIETIRLYRLTKGR